MERIRLHLNFFLFVLISVFCNALCFSQVNFSPFSHIPTAQGAYGVAVADFNGDGKPDCVTGGNSINLHVSLNTTAAGSTLSSFSPALLIRPTLDSGSFTELFTGDYNNDGKQDIAGAFQGNLEQQSYLMVFINTTGAGSSNLSFTQAFGFNMPFSAFGLCGADFNNDGKLDLACTAKDPYIKNSQFLIFLNNTPYGSTTPVFGNGIPFPTLDGEPEGICAADFNKDGKQDIACVNSGTFSISFFINKTLPGANLLSFDSSVVVQIPNQAFCDFVCAGDFNLDGKPDIACNSNQIEGAGSNGTIVVFMNMTTIGASALNFSSSNSFVTDMEPLGITTADINFDGKTDLIGANTQGWDFSVLINKTTPGVALPYFSDAQNFTTSSGPQLIKSADFNLDGKPDITLTTFSKNDIFFNITSGGIDSSTFYANTDFHTGENSIPNSIAAADYNLDGKLDMAYTTKGLSTFSVCFNTTPGGISIPSFTPKSDFTTGAGGTDICYGDFNLDGKPDVALTNGTAAANISVHLNITAPGSLTPSFASRITLATGNAPTGICSGDFNNDGKTDLACTNLNDNTVSVYINTTIPGASTISFSPKTDLATGNQPVDISTADFNGDGKMDLAAVNQNSNSVSVFFNMTQPGASSPTFLSRTDLGTAQVPKGICTADFNNDGKKDVAVTNSGISSFSIIINTTVPGSSTVSFAPQANFISLTQPYGISAGDVNGDGKTDIACIAGEGIYVALNNTTAGVNSALFLYGKVYSGGISPGDIVLADFNNDGKKDLMSSSNSGNTISVLMNKAVLQQLVKVTSLTASLNKQNVTLNWTTTLEENNTGFEIERNTSGSGWIKVGFVAGAGNSSSTKNYSFTVAGLNTGAHKFRLKHIHSNGYYEYHNLNQNVVIGIPQVYNLQQNYPNPFNPETIISYEIPNSGFVSLKIYDLSGREVRQLVSSIQPSGYYSIRFNSSGLSSGVYFYKLRAEGFTDAKKMVIVR